MEGLNVLIDYCYAEGDADRLPALALRHWLPTMADGRYYAAAWSLLSYGARPREICQRSAVLVHKNLHGATPVGFEL